MKKKILLLLGISVALMLLCAVIFNDAIVSSYYRKAIAHHRTAMNSAQYKLFNHKSDEVVIIPWWHSLLGLSDKSESTRNMEQYEYHRDRLVELGYLSHRTYVLDHITTGTDESAAIWRLIQTSFPENTHVTMPYNPETPEPVQVEVWDRPNRIQNWTSFFVSHDIADFRERFMR